MLEGASIDLRVSSVSSSFAILSFLAPISSSFCPDYYCSESLIHHSLVTFPILEHPRIPHLLRTSLACFSISIDRPTSQISLLSFVFLLVLVYTKPSQVKLRVP